MTRIDRTLKVMRCGVPCSKSFTRQAVRRTLRPPAGGEHEDSVHLIAIALPYLYIDFKQMPSTLLKTELSFRRNAFAFLEIELKKQKKCMDKNKTSSNFYKEIFYFN